MDFIKMFFNGLFVFIITLISTLAVGLQTQAATISLISAVLTAAVAAIIECQAEMEGKPPLIKKICCFLHYYVLLI